MKMVLRGAITGASVLAIGLLAPVSSANADEAHVEYPAGEFCPAFAVVGDIVVKGSEKMLPGDRLWGHAVGAGIWTKAGTSRSFTQRSRYASVVIYDEATNDVHVTIDGRYLVGFYAGDMGPLGPVTKTETYSVAGHQTFTFDLDTMTVTEYSLDGQILADVCAVLAGEN
jgi:hypothetical protein